MSIRIVFITLIFIPILSLAQSIAFQRNSELGQGINLGQFTTTLHDTTVESYVHHDTSDYAKMKLLGIDHIRIPTGFFFWTDTLAPYEINDTMLLKLDTIINEIRSYGLKIIIDFHNRVHLLTDTSYIQESNRIASAWKQIASRYANLSPDSTFFEIYNEPYFISDSTWNYVVKESIDSIRSVNNNHTLILANNQNFIFMYYDGVNIPDTNVIFTIHHYLPFIFTHQGSTWLETPLNSTGIPFPYNSSTMPPIHPSDVGTVWENHYNNYSITGNLNETRNRFITAKRITDSLGVPIYCGEFGCSNLAPIESRLIWIEGIRELLDSLEIPWAHWNWKTSMFSSFECESCANLDSISTNNLGYNIFCALGLENCNLSNFNKSKINKKKISLYPNPGSSIFTFTFPESIETIISISNISGKFILEEQINGNQAKINLSTYRRGIYLATVKNEYINQSLILILTD